ncbi:MAG: helix-turn-helix transcriptional regulator [Persicimonas sp.]
MTAKQWHEVAGIWSRVGRLSQQPVESVLRHVTRLLRSLLEGSHAMMVVQRRDVSEAWPLGFRLVEIRDFGHATPKRRERRRRWLQRNALWSTDPVVGEVGATWGRHRTLRFRAVAALSGAKPTAMGKLLDELDLADRLASILPLSADLEVAFCVDRPSSHRRFDGSEQALLHTITEGLKPLAMGYAGRYGLLPGQQRLDEDERRLVEMLLERSATRQICAALEISEEGFDRRRDTTLQKLGVDDEFGLLQLCARGTAVGAPEMASSKETTGPPRPSAVSKVTAYIPRAREVVLEQLDAEDLSMGVVAKRLGMSPRTLQRKLGAAQTSFTELVDGARRQRARELLCDTALDYTGVAMELGYDHVSSLNRAVQRWFNATPGELRRRAARPLRQADGIQD